MRSHDRPLLVIERTLLAEDLLRNPDLADVVQEGSDLDRLELFAVVPKASCERHGDGGHAARVTARVEVLRLHAPRQRGDRFAVGAAKPDVRLAYLVHRRCGPLEVP